MGGLVCLFVHVVAVVVLVLRALQAVQAGAEVVYRAERSASQLRNVAGASEWLGTLETGSGTLGEPAQISFSPSASTSACRSTSDSPTPLRGRHVCSEPQPAV